MAGHVVCLLIRGSHVRHTLPDVTIPHRHVTLLCAVYVRLGCNAYSLDPQVHKFDFGSGHPSSEYWEGFYFSVRVCGTRHRVVSHAGLPRWLCGQVLRDL